MGFALNHILSGSRDISMIGASTNLIYREGRLEQGSGCNSQEEAVTHISRERGIFGILWVASCFCLCLDKIIKWPCFVSICHGLKVALSDVGAL